MKRTWGVAHRYADPSTTDSPTSATNGSVDVQPAAGWYPHPDAPGWEAYWNGTAWGRETRPATVGTSTDRVGSGRALSVILLALGLAVLAVVVPFLPSGWISPTDVGYLVAGVASLLAVAGLTVAVLRIQGTAAALAAGLVVAAATVVAISLGLSLVDAYSRPAVIAVQLVVLAFVTGLWTMRGRPRPLVRLPSASELREKAVRHPSLAAILLALLVATWIEAVLALGVVPNNYDSMFYHLSRIGYWMQNDSVYQFYGGSLFQLQHPPNAEILQAWTMELTHGDRFAQFVQWSALIGLVLVVYSGARLLEFSRAASLFAAAVFGTLPLPVLEASSTQNDLVAAFFVSAAALFSIRAVAGRRTGDAIVAALALGLAIGTKGTVLIALPGLMVLIGVALWRWRPPRRFVAVASACALAAVLVLGVPNYAENARSTGSPIGETGSVKRREEPLPESALKTMSGFVDLPGRSAMPPLAGLLVSGEREIWGTEAAGVTEEIDVHEDFTGFGPIGLLLVLPLLAVTMFRSVPADRRLLAAVALSYIGIFLLFTAAQPFDMRLMVIPVALAAPLLASVAAIDWIRRPVVLVAVVLLIPVLFANQQKPLRPGDLSLAQDPAQQRGGSNENFDAMIRSTDAAISGDGRVGFVGSSVDWDYPLFGPHFDRVVVRLPTLGTWSDARAAMREHDLDSIVWALDPPPGAPAKLVNRPAPPWKSTLRWVTRANAGPR